MTTEPESLEPKRRPLRDVLFGSALGPFLGLIVVFGTFSVADAIVTYQEQRPRTFATLGTVQKLARDSSLTAVAALGMLIIIISGGIDLSAGTGLALCATVTAWMFRDGFDTATSITAGIVTGCLLGFVNGMLITRLKLVPFIVTLGMMTVARGIALVISNDSRVDANQFAPKWIYELQAPYPLPSWLIFSSGAWITVFLAIIVGVILRYSVFGRRVFAVGSNESTARLCGINVNRVRVAVYTVAGFFVGVAGLFFFAMTNGDVNPNEGLGKELVIIAAVVIGGGSLNGGRGSLLGTLSGACIMETITHGCTSLGIGTKYQHIIIGVIIIAAVSLDQFRQRRVSE